MLKVLDLFSGIGGFSIGLERTGGFETVAFCEIEKYPRAILAQHWPSVRIYNDVKTLTAEQLAADGIVPNTIVGGFPCQDISLAGKGAGLEGERSGLWWEFHRLIKEIRPQWVIAENVSALRSRGLDTVLRSLSEIGYDAEWHCIPASAIGAAHQRDRIWIIAYPNADIIDGRPEPQLANYLSGQTIRDELGGLRAKMADTASEQQQGDQGGVLCEQGWQSANAGAEDLRQKNGQTSSDITRSNDETLADTQSDGWQQRNEKFGGRTEGIGARQKFGFGDGSETLADTTSPRLSQRGRSEQQTSTEETRAGLVSEPERRGQDVADTEGGNDGDDSEDIRSASGEIDPPSNASGIGGRDDRSRDGETMADTDSEWQLQQKRFERNERGWPSNGGEEMADTSIEGLQGYEWFWPTGEEGQPAGHIAQCSWWAVEPDVGRVAHGVPKRVDRLKALGNAVVPQIPELIGYAILNSMENDNGTA